VQILILGFEVSARKVIASDLLDHNQGLPDYLMRDGLLESQHGYDEWSCRLPVVVVVLDTHDQSRVLQEVLGSLAKSLKTDPVLIESFQNHVSTRDCGRGYNMSAEREVNLCCLVLILRRLRSVNNLVGVRKIIWICWFF
jgi:hypothetical protein